MKPAETGKNYDRIARWWHERHHDSRYGIAQIENALKFTAAGGTALDVGCGAGGRIVHKLAEHGLTLTGIDVSAEMIALARDNHPGLHFHVADICNWDTPQRFDFIVAWDSIFHLPLAMHEPVIDKLCSWLEPGGVLIYTLGNATGEHTDTWHDEQFYYSSIGINANLKRLMQNGLAILHLELDQYPQKHAYIIAQRP